MNSDALARLEAVFLVQGISCPQLPPTLAPHIIEYAPNRFASRPLATGLYGLERFIADYIAETTPEPMVALGFDGHGLVSQAVHYYLMDQRVAVFVQQRWGTLLDDPELDRDRFAIMVKHAGKLLELAAAVNFPAGERLIAVQSSFSPPRFGWLANGSAVNWERCSAGSPIFAAVALRQRLSLTA